MKKKQWQPLQNIFRMQNSLFVLLGFSNGKFCVTMALKYIVKVKNMDVRK